MVWYHVVVPYKESDAVPPVEPQDEPALADVLAAFGELIVAQRRLRGRDARQPGDLSFAQLRMLAALDEAESCAGARLAERAGVSPGTASVMLDQLEERGIVARVRSDEDRRVVLTRLTEEGRRLRDARRREVRAAFAEALAELDDDQLAQGARVLRLLAGAMEAM